MANQAQGNRVQVAYIPEVTYGVTPATPQLKLVERVEFTANTAEERIESRTIRPDRQKRESRRGNSSVEGTFEVELVPDDVDGFIEAALRGTWDDDEVSIGNVQRSFTFEKGFLDLGKYQVLTGVMLNTMSIEVTTEQYVSVAFGLMGKNASALTGTSLDSTPTAAGVHDFFWHADGTYLEGGAAVANFSTLSFTLNNNSSGTKALGTNGFRHVNAGAVDVTGSVTGLFENEVQYNKYMIDVDSSLSFTLNSGARSLTFTFPKVKYTSAVINDNSDAGISVTMAWEASYDPTATNTMTVTRN